MLELPEVLNISSQLKATVAGLTVEKSLPPTKAHKFCWFNGDAADYSPAVSGAGITGARGFGIFAELELDNGKRLCFNDGVNVRYIPAGALPKDYQLALLLDNDMALCFTVAMYGGIILHSGDYDNEYYEKSAAALSPFAPGFDEHFDRVLAQCKPNLSAKAVLAAEQRFPGVGNGAVQDILFASRINPKRKLDTISAAERDTLRRNLRSILSDMTEKGGRDTERDLFGSPGGYRTLMSKNSMASGCPVCGGAITKEAYMGGSVYYCKTCQPL